MKINKFNNIPIISILYIVVGFLIFFYIITRSIVLDITFDEAWTLRDFVPQSLTNILTYTSCDANNHLLNTILIKFFYSLFPDTLFVARLPNLIASLVFIIFAQRTCKMFLSYKIGFICFIILLTNPFLLDFFSQARGYGLALGFQMASLYYLLKYIKKAHPKYIVKMLIFSFFGVLSVFVMINFFIAEICVIVLLSLLNSKKYSWKPSIIYSFIFSTILFIIIFTPITKLVENNCLYYGGRNNFYQDTLLSLTQFSIYSPSIKPIVNLILNIFIILFSCVLFYSFKNKQSLISLKNGIILILFLCIIAVILQYYIFDTLYVLDRAALYFYPLIILTLFFSLNDISNNFIIYSMLIVLLLFFELNFSKNANFKKTALNYFEAHTEEIFEIINNVGIKENRMIKIDFSWPFESSFKYYISKQKYSNIILVKNPNNRTDLNLEFDFYIYLSRQIDIANYWAKSEKILYFQNNVFKFIEFPEEDIIVYRKRILN